MNIQETTLSIISLVNNKSLTKKQLEQKISKFLIDYKEDNINYLKDIIRKQEIELNKFRLIKEYLKE
jgi:hypothetical protein